MKVQLFGELDADAVEFECRSFVIYNDDGTTPLVAGYSSVDDVLESYTVARHAADKDFGSVLRVVTQVRPPSVVHYNLVSRKND
jgi:hypothetical protein